MVWLMLAWPGQHNPGAPALLDSLETILGIGESVICLWPSEFISQDGIEKNRPPPPKRI